MINKTKLFTNQKLCIMKKTNSIATKTKLFNVIVPFSECTVYDIEAESSKEAKEYAIEEAKKIMFHCIKQNDNSIVKRSKVKVIIKK
jgi:hypothetical protein